MTGSIPAKNPVDVLREWLTKAGVYDDEPWAALADVENLAGAVRIAKLEGRFEPVHDAFEPFEEGR